MNIDLMHELDASFGDGPEHPSIESRIRAGERALLVRRTTAGVAVAALAAAVAAGLALVPRASDPVPTSPAPSPRVVTETTTSPEQAEEDRLTDALVVDTSWRSRCDHAGQPSCDDLTMFAAWVGYLPDGTLARIDDTIVVVKRSDDPGSRPDDKRVALEVRSTARGRSSGVQWFLLRFHAGTYSVSTFGHSMVDFDTFATNLWAGHAKAEGMPPRAGVDKVIGR